METLMAGALLPDRLAWAQQPPKQLWPSVVGMPALYAAMESAMKARNARAVPHSVSFSPLLERMLGVVLFKGQKQYTNELVGELGVPQNWTLLSSRQLSCINLPTLAECRAGFEKYLGQKLDWPDQNDDERETTAEGPGY